MENLLNQQKEHYIRLAEYHLKIASAFIEDVIKLDESEKDNLQVERTKIHLRNAHSQIQCISYAPTTPDEIDSPSHTSETTLCRMFEAPALTPDEVRTPHGAFESANHQSKKRQSLSIDAERAFSQSRYNLEHKREGWLSGSHPTASDITPQEPQP